MMHMFRKVGGMHHEEKECITELIAAYGKLEIVQGQTVTMTPSGRASCEAFIQALQKAGETLNTEYSNRDYRNLFTSNYKLLLPSSSRSYRIDVFEASIEQQHMLYVNGEKYDISAATLESAQLLQAVWASMGSVLKSSLLSDHSRNPLHEVRSMLERIDRYWAGFEKSYILELIDIETRARSIIVTAAEQEMLLTIAEENNICVEQRRCDLVRTISWLNSCANHRRKGRDDLDVSILEKAMALQTRGTSDVAATLGRDVIGSFDALRAYFRQAVKVIERVDPHLGNNPGLVERLVDWETSWEVGQKYVRHTPMFNAITDVIAEIGRVQDVAPALGHMIVDCDVELFLCVPRIIWLRFLAEPAGCCELLKDLLPHRFPADEELQTLQAHYQNACRHLLHAHASSSLRPSSAVLELLARRVVAGTDGAEALYREMLPALAGDAEPMRAVEIFMNELERWSMELQRHCPEDWNQCSSIIVQCLLSEPDAPDEKSDMQFTV